MATELITDRKFTPDSLLIIQRAQDIVQAYEKQGLKLTLRQLYYQFVARDLLPNSVQSYKRLGSIVNDARYAGYIDWEMIEDRTRGIEVRSRFDSPREAIEVVSRQYHIDMWSNQPKRVEVWIEKEALVGVIEPTCRSYDVPYLACRGYVSASESYRAYRRIREYAEAGVETVVLHLGDHDPSGIDMTRDNRDRLDQFLRYGENVQDADHDLTEMVTVRRIALNMEQIEKYKPPENPAKITDSRFDGYAKKYGLKSWELDALEPKVLADLITRHINQHIDAERWSERLAQLKTEKATLAKIIEGLK